MIAWLSCSAIPGEERLRDCSPGGVVLSRLLLVPLDGLVLREVTDFYRVRE